MGEARNFKFGTLIDLDKFHLKHDKILPPKRAIFKFQTPSFNLEWVKLETSNLVY